MDPFAVVDRRLVLAEGRGEEDGPRVIDAAARLVRFADPSRTIPFHELRAVASISAMRLTPSLDRFAKLAPKIRPALVLVPRRLPGEVAAWLDATESGRPQAEGFSVRDAAAQIDRASVPVYNPHTPLESRRSAKAIARLAGLPMLELYGEFPVWRRADKLDISLTERLRSSAPMQSAGPPPAGVQIAHQDHTMDLFVAPPARCRWPWFVASGVVAAASVPLLLGPTEVGIAALIMAIITFMFAWYNKPRPTSCLHVSRTSMCWSCGEHPESFETDKLEMMRVAEDGTLVLVQQDDETRC